MNYHIAKIHNSGNSFLLYLGDKANLSTKNIQKLCDARYGVGGDGLIWIEPKDDQNLYQLCFFNNNGTEFLMSFNGTLCVAFFLKQFLKVSSEVRISIPALGITSVNYSESIRISFQVPNCIITKKEFDNGQFSGVCFSVPLLDNHHVVVTDKNHFNDADFLTFASALRSDTEVFQRGANVHFAYIDNETIYIRHYEKGIENETLSCGSGCIATAIVLENIKILNFRSIGGWFKIHKISDTKWSFEGRPELIAIFEQFI